MPEPSNHGTPNGREPVFNAPLLSWLVPVVLIGLYALQSSLGPYTQDELIESFGLKPVLLRNGEFELLLTHLFLHGSWVHVLANAAFCFTFSAPVVRACGRGFGGGLSYLAFYLLCGVIAGLGDSLLNWSSAVPILGASGAISGLMGAAIRLRVRPGQPVILARLTDPSVISMTIFWCGVNALSALVPMLMGVEKGQGIAWQAHVIGYVFGLLSIGAWLRITHPRAFTTS